MGNLFSAAAPSLLLRDTTHDPCFRWKIRDFSALVQMLQRPDQTITSAAFHCSGYRWALRMTPWHTKNFYSITPYVALSLLVSKNGPGLDLGYVVEAVFELSIYNISNRAFRGRKASHSFHVTDAVSDVECLMPLAELLDSSDFLRNDCCVFGLEILKINVCSPERNPIVVQKMGSTFQSLFIRKYHFLQGEYTMDIPNFLEFSTQHFFPSPTFVVGGCKWYIRVYPRGNSYSRSDCLSLFLRLDSLDKFPRERGRVVRFALSVLDQKNGEYFTKKGSGLAVFAGKDGGGWSDFMPLSTFKDPSKGFLVGPARCVIKAEITIIGYSNDGRYPEELLK